MATSNRAERRKSKFGGGRATEQGGWPVSHPNPALEPDAKPPTGSDEAVAGMPDQDQTSATGPGTGGATEQAGRVPRHAGTHATNSAKG